MSSLIPPESRWEMSLGSATTIRAPVLAWTMLSIPSRSAPPGATTSRALRSRGPDVPKALEAHPQAATTSSQGCQIPLWNAVCLIPSGKVGTAIVKPIAHSEVESTVVAVVMELLRGRLAGDRRVGAGRVGVADEGPGERGAEGAERDRDPGRAGDRRRRSESPLALQRVEGGARSPPARASRRRPGPSPARRRRSRPSRPASPPSPRSTSARRRARARSRTAGSRRARRA